jgi:hypothetical protein
MLSMGKTVIATHVTGHTAFLNTENARLITIDRLEPAMLGAYPGAWAAWDVPQHQQLVQHLREVHASRQQHALPRNDAGVATARDLTWDAAADALINVVSALAAD